jgi:hypothetical protein
MSIVPDAAQEESLIAPLTRITKICVGFSVPSVAVVGWQVT